MTSPDLTPKEYALRFILREISKLEARKDQLSAHLLDLDNVCSPEFREQVGQLGALIFDLRELRRLEARYRGIPA